MFPLVLASVPLQKCPLQNETCLALLKMNSRPACLLCYHISEDNAALNFSRSLITDRVSSVFNSNYIRRITTFFPPQPHCQEALFFSHQSWITQRERINSEEARWKSSLNNEYTLHLVNSQSSCFGISSVILISIDDALGSLVYRSTAVLHI